MCVLSGKFDARVREIFRILASLLHVPPLAFILVSEEYLAQGIVGHMRKDTKESSRVKAVRRLKVAGFAVAVGAVTALTAGLAAPAIAAGFGALGIAGTSGAAAFLSTIGGSAAVASVFGAGTAGLTGWKYSKRIGKLKVFQFDRVTSRRITELSPKSRTSNKGGLSGFFQGTFGVKIWEPRNNIVEVSPTKAAAKAAEAETVKKKQDKGPIPKELSCQLNATICISGWLRSIDDVQLPWRQLAAVSTADVYALRWDPDILEELGNFLVTLLSQKFAVTAAQYWLQYTVAAGLSTALMWPVALIQYAATLDNTWMACRERAVQAGRLLAEVLCDTKAVGSRPVNLVGFSMGARVILSCIQELHRRHAFNRVGDVVVMGAPTSCNAARWRKCREVVAGRLINVYSKTDWVLGFMYRYMEWGVMVAGLSPVKVDGVENVDVTGIVRSSHSSYLTKTADILTYVGMHGHVSQFRRRTEPEET